MHVALIYRELRSALPGDGVFVVRDAYVSCLLFLEYLG
jgi:hypothetical protein